MNFFFCFVLFCFALLCFALLQNRICKNVFVIRFHFSTSSVAFAVAESNFVRLFCDRSWVLLHHLLRCCCIRLQGCLAIGVHFPFTVCFAPTSAFFIVCVAAAAAAASDCKFVDLLYELFSSSYIYFALLLHPMHARLFCDRSWFLLHHFVLLLHGIARLFCDGISFVLHNLLLNRIASNCRLFCVVGVDFFFIACCWSRIATNCRLFCDKEWTSFL